MGNCLNKQNRFQGDQQRTKPAILAQQNPGSLQIIDEKEINGEYLRKIREHEMNGFHNLIGALIFEAPNGEKGKGTATLISRNLILTVAHNIYDKKHKFRYTNFKFYLAPSGIGNVENYYQVQADCWRYPIQFEKCSFEDRYRYDYAIMKLKTDCKTPQLSFLPLSNACRKCQSRTQTLKLSIFGYPSHKFIQNYIVYGEQEKQIEIYQYGLTRTVKTDIDPSGKMTYPISTLSGQSGCPIINNNQIIGVHLGAGSQTENYNYGRLITENFIENLDIGRLEMKGECFSVTSKINCTHNLSHEIQSSSEVKLITELNLNDQQLQTVDLTSYPRLKTASICNNALITIDLRNNLQLSHLWLGNNRIYGINLKRNTNIAYLGLSSNKLTEIDLRQSFNLLQVYLSDNELTEIDLSENIKINHLEIKSNKLEKITIWYSEKLFLELQNQRSKNCHITLLYRNVGDIEKCESFGKSKILEYNTSKSNSNITNCNYSFTSKKNN